MTLGLYVHIPYCIQKCHYCDFITVDREHAISPDKYVLLLCQEISDRASILAPQKVSSLYFGGGTPSLLSAEQIVTIIQAFAKSGFTMTPGAEITIEINPGTVDSEKLDLYLAGGVNRFSLGAQTFNSEHLRFCGREHSTNDSREALQLFHQRQLNFSVDLLFGLPRQTLNDLYFDLEQIGSYEPPHISLYNLNVPNQHFMNSHRPTDDLQAEMFDVIENHLSQRDYARYEISNFAKPGFESRHNMIYWTNHHYLGFGVSAHSYIPDHKPWGLRFWNPSNIYTWEKQVLEKCNWSPSSGPRLPQKQLEPLLQNESLTDFMHTSLRKSAGVEMTKVLALFGDHSTMRVRSRLESLLKSGMVQEHSDTWALTANGKKLANRVFLELTFSAEDLH